MYLNISERVRKFFVLSVFIIQINKRTLTRRFPPGWVNSQRRFDVGQCRRLQFVLNVVARTLTRPIGTPRVFFIKCYNQENLSSLIRKKLIPRFIPICNFEQQELTIVFLEVTKLQIRSSPIIFN